MHRHIFGHSHTQADIHVHAHALCCITNDGTLIAVPVYLLLAVMDGLLLGNP